jgi:hypothetical protein
MYSINQVNPGSTEVLSTVAEIEVNVLLSREMVEIIVELISPELDYESTRNLRGCCKTLHLNLPPLLYFENLKKVHPFVERLSFDECDRTKSFLALRNCTRNEGLQYINDHSWTHKVNTCLRILIVCSNLYDPFITPFHGVPQSKNYLHIRPGVERIYSVSWGNGCNLRESDVNILNESNYLVQKRLGRKEFNFVVKPQVFVNWLTNDWFFNFSNIRILLAGMDDEGSTLVCLPREIIHEVAMRRYYL